VSAQSMREPGPPGGGHGFSDAREQSAPTGAGGPSPQPQTLTRSLSVKTGVPHAAQGIARVRSATSDSFGEEIAWEDRLPEGPKSGDGEQFLLLHCKAVAHVKGVFFSQTSAWEIYDAD